MPLVINVRPNRGDGLVIEHLGERLDVEIQWDQIEEDRVRLLITGPLSFAVDRFLRQERNAGRATEEASRPE